MRSEEKRSRPELVRAQRLTSDQSERPVPHVPDLTIAALFGRFPWPWKVKNTLVKVRIRVEKVAESSKKAPKARIVAIAGGLLAVS